MSAYAHFLRRVVLPLGDWYRGIPIGAVLRSLSESQWWPPEKLAELQNAKLRSLVKAAFEHVPYYRQCMQERGIRPEDIQTVDDLTRLPLLTKGIIRQRPPTEMTNGALRPHEVYTSRTGGSTGEPLHFLQSKSVRAFDRASYYRFLEWCGVQRGDEIFSVWGQLVVADRHTRLVKALKLRLITRQQFLDAFRMTPETVRAFVTLMHRRRPALLRGYTSALMELARLAKQEHLTFPPLRSVTSTAEQLTDGQRRVIEQAFGAPLFDQYGCGEVGGLAYECDRHDGLHIAVEHCIVEIVDEEGRPLPPGQPGRVVLTNLDNEAQPFIRYVNGDEASLMPGTCACGRHLPRMSALTGRTADMLIGPNGNRAHGEFFTHLVHELGWTEQLAVREFQVVQTSAERLEFRLVSPQHATAEQVAELEKKIRAYLGPMQVDFRQVERIDRGRTGKLRFTVREWHPEATAAEAPAEVTQAPGGAE